MRIILNLIWLVLSGFWLAIGYVLTGIVCCVLVITIPWGLAAFRIANYALWPFGRQVVDRADAGTPSLLGNVIWIVVAGIWLAIGHVVTGVLLCVTIIGIPLGVANFKMVPVSLMPLGKVIVPA
ncbi:Inner membrane protein YccF [Actinosynnema sp. ALI-1.44]